MSDPQIKQALYVAVLNKIQGELSELEAREVLLTSNPTYITSKDHDHANHIEELKNIILAKNGLSDTIAKMRATYFSAPPKKDDKKNS
jgi:hypothetical protein|tara:strand:+ start:1380 stop:1643 length:264 start_codon:yes stop_codon:yes gene_type:complete